MGQLIGADARIQLATTEDDEAEGDDSEDDEDDPKHVEALPRLCGSHTRS
jgi:hypothetical protein